MLDSIDIYDKCLRDLDSLAGVERLIFILQDFDNLMEMEGWDHFFLYEHHFIWYPEIAVGDSLLELPLFLKPEYYVPAPLETSYQAAWNDFPQQLKHLLERP